MNNQKTDNSVPEHLPKLKMASKEIQEILTKYDIAGFIDLFEPGHNEIVIKLDPSWSAATIKDNRRLEIIPILEGVDDEARKKKIADTINMVYNIRRYSSSVAGVLIQAEQALRVYFKVGPPPGPDGIVLKPSNGKHP